MSMLVTKWPYDCPSANWWATGEQPELITLDAMSMLLPQGNDSGPHILGEYKLKIQFDMNTE